MTHHHAGHHGHSRGGSVLEVSFRNCHDASEYADLEGNLATVPGVTSVHLDRTRGVAHLGYDAGRVTPEELERRLHTAGYACDCEDERPSAAQPGHPQIGHEHHGGNPVAQGHSGHAAQHASAVHDPHAEHHPETVTGHQADHGAHAEMGHDEHAGHGAEMVNDMLRRFVVSLLLTLPIVLFSPIGESLGFRLDPPFGLGMAWFGLILATPVVWWGGWPFISAAWRALRRGEHDDPDRHRHPGLLPVLAVGHAFPADG